MAKSSSFVGYAVLRFLFRMVIHVFFSKVSVGGLENVPRDGAVVFTGNHPNGLLDAIILLVYCPRYVHYLAKDTLWKNPVLRFFLWIAHVVPIRRRQDHAGHGAAAGARASGAPAAARADNSQAFTAMHRVLQEGGCMGIFPEGISHFQSQITELKTGTARIIFGAMQGEAVRMTTSDVRESLETVQVPAEIKLAEDLGEPLPLIAGGSSSGSGSSSSSSANSSSSSSTADDGGSSSTSAVGHIDPPFDLVVIPSGLTYVRSQTSTDTYKRRYRFRSQVHLEFGSPLVIDGSMLHRHSVDNVVAVRELTATIKMRMMECTLNADSWETLRLAHTTRRLYVPPDARISMREHVLMTRHFVEGYNRVAHLDDVAKLREDVAAYQQRLDMLKLKDGWASQDFSWTWSVSLFFSRFVLLMILLPLALVGFVLHSPIAAIGKLAALPLVRSKTWDVVATMELIAGIFAVFLFYAIYFFTTVGLVVEYDPDLWWIILVVGFGLPITGYASVRIIEEEVALWRALVSMVRVMHYRRELAELREERKQLGIRVLNIVNVHAPKDMTLKFPHGMMTAPGTAPTRQVDLDVRPLAAETTEDSSSAELTESA